jgi:hypothetical protein
MITATALALVGTVIVPEAALAACAGSQTKGAIQAKNDDSPARGVRSDIWVNNFDSHQYQSWRQVNVVGNPNNYAEAGWFTGESASDQLAHPFKSYLNNGVGGTVRYTAIDISPRDDLHQFAVKDPDDNNVWTWTLDGNQYGTTTTVTIIAGSAFADSGSERSCTSDNLWSKFRSLQVIDNAQGNWNNWSNIDNDINANKAPYDYCGISNHAYDIKQSC